MIDFLKKINWEEKIFSLSFSIFGIILFVFFWVYGFFGALSSGGQLKNIFFFIFLTLILIFFCVLWAQKNPLNKKILSISWKDIGVFFLLFLFLLPFSFSSLSLSLVNDGLAHAQQSQTHGLSLIYLFSSQASLFDSIPLWLLLWGINAALLLFGVSLFLLFRKRPIFLKILILSVAFLGFRFLIAQFGGSGSPHPPFRLFPLWLSSAIFSPSDFSFRLAQFSGLMLFGWALWRVTRRKFGDFSAFFFSGAVITIPVLWHTGVIVEQSLWAASALGFALVFLWVKKELETQDYLLLFSLISIATLMRQSAFIAFLPVFVSLGFAFWKKNISFRDAAFVSAPIFLCAPFLFHSFFLGTSATYIPGEISSIPSDSSAFFRVWYAVQSGILWTAIRNSIEWVWVFLAFVPFALSFKNPKRLLALLVLLFSAIFIFYSIRPGLWGIGRYQAEYIIPFAILGLFLFSISVQKKVSLYPAFLPVIFCALIGLNVFQFLKIPELNASVTELTQTFTEKIKERGEYRILSEFPYEYGRALRVARAEGYGGNVYIAGSTYGIFPNILAGATVSEALSAKRIFGEEELRNNVDALLPKAIHENMRIQLVLISDMQNKEAFLSDLKKLGWHEWKNFENTRFQSRIEGFIRN